MLGGVCELYIELNDMFELRNRVFVLPTYMFSNLSETDIPSWWELHRL